MNRMEVPPAHKGLYKLEQVAKNSAWYRIEGKRCSSSQFAQLEEAYSKLVSDSVAILVALLRRRRADDFTGEGVATFDGAAYCLDGIVWKKKGYVPEDWYFSFWSCYLVPSEVGSVMMTLKTPHICLCGGSEVTNFLRAYHRLVRPTEGGF